MVYLKKERTPEEDGRVFIGAIGGAMLGGAVAGPLGAIAGFIVGAAIAEGANKEEKRREAQRQ